MRLKNTRKHAAQPAGFFDELLVDEFAGGGGASLGIEMATGRCVDLAVNHCPNAIMMHNANHPNTRHECQSVWDVDPVQATDNKPVGLAWFSPDCKHFSKAKGGKPVSKKIRGLAWIVIKWATKVQPRVICLENVEEFLTWGPLLPNDKPDPARKGETFQVWKSALERLGYKVEWRILKACDYGVPTIRKRLFLVARCDGKTIVWPAPTHSNPKAKGFKATKLKPWRTAAECIDFDAPCPSIFTRPRPLKPATCKRIARGIQRYVIDAAEPFIVQTSNSKTTGRGNYNWPTDEPLRTATSSSSFGVVAPHIVEYHATTPGSDERVKPVTDPLPTQTVENRFGLAGATLVNVTHQGGDRTKPVNEPMETITGANRGEKASIIAHLTGVGGRAGQSRPRGVDEPTATTTSKADTSLIAANITKLNFGDKPCSGADEPLHTIVAQGTTQALTAAHITRIGQTGGNGSYSKSPEDPLTTITSKNEHLHVASHLSHMYGQSVGSGVDEPTRSTTGCNHQAHIAAWIAKHYGNGVVGHKPDQPIGTVTQVDHHSHIAAHLTKLYGTCEAGVPVDQPGPTVTADGQHLGHVAAFLQKYYGNEKDGVSLSEPMHTVPTKDRFGFVASMLVKASETFPPGFWTVWQFLADHLGPDAPPPVVWVKGEMYVIVDIGMRMLTPRELARAQGFPDSYILTGTKTNQVARIGNSVCPEMARVIVAANYTDRPVTSSSRRVA